MKIYLKTFGCKLNQAESQELKERLVKEQFSFIDSLEKADFFIIKTCSVTYDAERSAKQLINQIKRKNKKAKIFITGCFLKKEKDVYYLKSQKKIIERIKELSENRRKEKKEIKGKTRAFIKIQDGCDNFCAYCIIPYLRGKPKSVSSKKIIKQIQEKEKQGCQEIVLTGVNICKHKNLITLIKKILLSTKIPRIRLGSLDPSLREKEFLKLFENKRICPHMHLSLQSGSDRILKKMNRRYTGQEYLNLIKKIKKNHPQISLTTDVIVGFPGETEKDFQQTINLIKKAEFLKVHFFPYSPRPGTKSDLIKERINYQTKKERCKRLERICLKVREKKLKETIGKKENVLFERKKDNYWIGYTPQYLLIRKKSKENLENKIKEIEIKKNNLSLTNV